jgi:predicted nucleic acid-binding protein
LRKYLIDTSSLAKINESPAKADRWKAVEKLIDNGRLKTVALVFEELARVDPEAYQRLKPRKKAMVVKAGIRVLQAAGEIAYNYPRMARTRSRRGRADTYVVATAKLDGFWVVTDESVTRRGRIPWVCDKEDVKRCSLDELLNKEWMPNRR